MTAPADWSTVLRELVAGLGAQLRRLIYFGFWSRFRDPRRKARQVSPISTKLTDGHDTLLTAAVGSPNNSKRRI